MTDWDYAYCIANLEIDNEEELLQYCPTCAQKMQQTTECPICGKPSVGAVRVLNQNFDDARFEMLKNMGDGTGDDTQL